MAGAAGLEPVTSAVTGQRSNQLSYAPAWGRRTYEMSAEPSSETESRRAVKLRTVDLRANWPKRAAGLTFRQKHLNCPEDWMRSMRCCCLNVRAADAKEVGVGNPAEETYCHPNWDQCTLQYLLLSTRYR